MRIFIFGISLFLIGLIGCKSAYSDLTPMQQYESESEQILFNGAVVACKRRTCINVPSPKSGGYQSFSTGWQLSGDRNDYFKRCLIQEGIDIRNRFITFGSYTCDD